MTRNARVVAVLAVLLGASVVSAADKKKDKALDPAIQAQVDAAFTRMDLNKDGYLDKDELSRFIRGQPTKVEEDGKPQFIKPHEVFLRTHDEDQDGKLTRGEFQDVGPQMEAQYKKSKELQDKATKLEKDYKKATDAQRKAYDKLRKEYQEEMERAYREFQQQMEKQYNQAMKGKGRKR